MENRVEYYQMLTKSLDSNDHHEQKEAYDGAADLAGKKTLEAHEEILLEAVVKKVISEKSIEGPHIGFLNKLNNKIDELPESGPPHRMLKIMDKIATSESTNPQTRIAALNALMKVWQSGVSDQTVEIFTKALENPKETENPRSFTGIAAQHAVDITENLIGKKFPEDSPLRKVYDLVTQKFVDGKLPEDFLWKLIRTFGREGYGDTDYNVMLKVADSQNLPTNIRDLAKRYLKNYQ